MLEILKLNFILIKLLLMSSSTNAKLISRRYAKALFKSAEKIAQSELIEKDLQKFTEVFNSSDAIKNLASNPTINSKNTKEAISLIANKINVNDKLKDFLNLLIENRRLSLVDEILDFYSKLVMNKNDEVGATLITISQVSDVKIKEFENRLSDSLNKKIRLKSKQDRSILGGAIIQIGSKMLDASLSQKIKQIEILSKKAISNI